MPYRADNREAISRLFQRLRNDFGEASGESIIKAIIEECGGLRLSLPDMQALYRQERDEYIRMKFNGQNHEELSIAFDLSKSQIRRIVHGDK